MLQTADGLAAVLRVGVEQRRRNRVLQGGLADLDAGLQQVVHLLLGGVLQLLQAGHRHVRVELLPVEVRTGQHIAGFCREGLVAMLSRVCLWPASACRHAGLTISSLSRWALLGPLPLSLGT